MSEDKLEEMIQLLRELVKWSKFESVPKLKTILEQNLRNDKEKLTYELSDGTRSTRDIAKVAGVSHTAISNYWEKWSNLGIVVKAGTREGRYKHVCSLKEVGLEVPQLREEKQQEGQTLGSD